MNKTKRFQDKNAGAREERINQAVSNVTRISPRETEVLKLIALGNTNSKIAAQLGISSHTVNAHRVNLMAKLDLHSAQDVTMVGLKSGLVAI